MNNRIRLVSIIIILLITLSSCGTIDRNTTGSNEEQADGKSAEISDVPADSSAFEAEVLQAGTSLLIAPDKESNEYRSSDKISVNLIDCKITDKEGNVITAEEIKAGDILTISYNGVILESYPAQLTANAISVKDHNILMDGYLAIIDDIYQEDKGLNSDIEMIALDTSEWTGLDDAQKEAVFSELKNRYEVDIVEGTFDTLSEQGLIDKDNLYFPKGILITVSISFDEKKQKLAYSIEKWRSGLGAIGTDDGSAEYDKGEWKITKKNVWKS